MRVSKKRGLGEPEIKMVSAKELEEIKRRPNGKHKSIYSRIRRKK